jgi:sigma-E factor negative regulatory protein RseA
MKEELSALVDNELSELEERRVLKTLAADPALRDTWGRYHLIRAALRRELEITSAPGLASRVTAHLAVLSPARAAFVWRPLAKVAGSLAIAATVAAVTLVGLQLLQRPDGAGNAVVATSAPAAAPVRVGATRWDTNQPELERTLNVYLVEHNEFSSTGVGGMLPYVRVVGYDNDR